ncbi:uncharacterized protein LOC135216537 [Macrobrachium nipponense]|uniref:uncharacterized protein LOC135216537 n=1 Tax=Macrobrachium nipponense TaxID=159736 RepID=UPI0030C809D1
MAYQLSQVVASALFCAKSQHIISANLPHFGIKKQSHTTPLCIVFNTLSKVKGELLLNDCLYPDPNLAELLYDFLIKFRQNPHTLISDISKAFHRVLLCPDDTKYAYFLWRQGPTRMATYTFNVVVFGITSSPYILQQVLRTCLQERRREDLVKSFYVDNYLQTYKSLDQMESDYSEVRSLLDEYHMPLTGWASSSELFD